MNLLFVVMTKTHVPLVRFLLSSDAEASVTTILLLLACEHQYLAIPGAQPVTGYVVAPNEATAPPTWEVSGELPDEVGESATINVGLDPTWPFSTTEIVVTVWVTATVSYAEYWVYELSDEEREAGEAAIEVMLADSPPSQEVCQGSGTRNNRTCFGPVDEGIESTGWHASTGNGGDASTGAPIPIMLDPLTPPDDGGGQCDTFESCCGCTWDSGLGTNICPVECYVVAACDCPSGSNDRGDGPEGTRACECPS